MKLYYAMLFFYILFFYTGKVVGFPAAKISCDKDLGLPLIRNYSAREYGAADQNWAIIQDRQGIMYFGNNFGVLEYDGSSWRLISVPNEVVRSLAMDSTGCIYLGGYNEIGYLAADSAGNLKYHSLLHLIPVGDRKFGHVWNTLVSENEIYFQSYSHIFRIKTNQRESRSHPIQAVKIWRPVTNFHLSFVVNGQYFVLEQNRGLFTIDEDSLRLTPGGARFDHDTVFLMHPRFGAGDSDSVSARKHILVYSKPSGFFLYDGKTFTPFKTEADAYLKENILYMKSSVLPDGRLALGTVHGGLVLMNQEGKITQIVDPQAGLADPTVYATFVDRNGTLWLALQNGITRFSTSLPFTLFDKRLGIESEVNSIIRFKGRLYCATMRGIRILSPKTGSGKAPSFTKVPGIALQSWDLLEANKHLLAASTDGVAEIDGEQAVKIPTSWHNALSLYHSRRDSTILFVGLLDGLAVLKFRNGTWQDAGRINEVTEDIRYITEDSKGNLWLGAMLQKVIKLSPLPDGTFAVRRYDGGGRISGVYSLYNIHNQIIVATGKGFLRYDTLSDCFVKDSDIPFSYQEDVRRSFQVVTDKENRTWIQEETMNNARIFVLKNGVLKPLPLLQLAGDRNLGHSIYPSPRYSRVFWLGGSEKIVRFTYSEPETLSYPVQNTVLLRKITVNNDSLLFGGSGVPGAVNELPFHNNTLSFEFALPGAVDESMVRYQYFLLGFNKGWSDWTSQHIKLFEQLPSGAYVFKVRARDVLGRVSNAASFAFKIRPPWYRAWWAYTFYLFLIILIIYAMLRSRFRYLERKAKKLELLVAKRTQKIREQSEKLKEMDRLKSRFFANITHEFRTPLTLIMGQIESVLASGGKETAKLKMAARNTRRLQQLINQLLDLAKIEVQGLKLNRAAHELVPFLRGLVYSFESLAKQKMITLNFYSESENIVLEFDSKKMEEVFENLLSNALKFTPRGGAVSVTLQITENEDEKLTESAGKFTEIHVKDTGLGIAADKLPHIFDRFYQADSSKTRDYEGTGLGLALVKELVELHHGRITVRSKPGLGTDFTIKLPFQEQSTVSAQPAIPNYKPQKKTMLSDITEDAAINQTAGQDEVKQLETILIIEDNADMRVYLRQNLESEFHIREAENGKTGLQRAAEIMPDLIISDVMMPVMDGFELVKELKKNERTSHIPVILLTARASLDDKIDGIESGADAYLSKPFNQQELLARAKNLIHSRQQLRKRFSKATVIRPSEISAVSADQAFLEKVVTIIDARISDETFSVEVLAEEAAFSVTHLNRKLRALIDQSAGQLIRSMRMQRAANLLKKHAGNVAQIALKVGFSDQASFTRSFKKQFGCPPGAYNKKQ